MTFETWKNEVDDLFAVYFYGLTSDDMPDWLWRDEFDEGVTPQEAFDNWLYENDYT